MAIGQGDRLPSGQLLMKGKDGIEQVDPSAIPGRAAIFAVPGAFTGTCTNEHMPSFVRTADQFRAKGIDRVVCVTVNDPSVAAAWAESTGADAAGIEVLADADGAWTKAMGMDFDAPQAGFHGRSKRYAMLVRDGVIEVMQAETGTGGVTVSGGEALLEQV